MKRRFVVRRWWHGEESFLQPQSWRRGLPVWDVVLQSARRLRRKKAQRLLVQLEGMVEGEVAIYEVVLALLGPLLDTPKTKGISS